MTASALRIAITPGEPAGIGPDVVLMAAQEDWPAQLVVVADPSLLEQRAARLGLAITLNTFTPEEPAQRHRAGTLAVAPVALAQPAVPGELNTANAAYVLDTLRRAVHLCSAGQCQAMVTGPVQKSVINDAGVPFIGHTEFLAAETATDRVVMMLATDELRVALATTHLPLKDVPAAITVDLLQETLTILHADLQRKFGIETPRHCRVGAQPARGGVRSHGARGTGYDCACAQHAARTGHAH